MYVNLLAFTITIAALAESVSTCAFFFFACKRAFSPSALLVPKGEN